MAPSSKPIGPLLIQTARLQRVRTAQRLEKLGLFPGQDSVLEMLLEHGPLTIGRLAELLHVRAPTISKAVTRLAAAQMLERREGEDGRQVAVALTKRGRAKALKALAITAEVEQEAAAGLDDRDRRRLRKLLRKMEKNLAGVAHALSDGDEDEGPSKLRSPA